MVRARAVDVVSSRAVEIVGRCIAGSCWGLGFEWRMSSSGL
jgi:hypothetical protein